MNYSLKRIGLIVVSVLILLSIIILAYTMLVFRVTKTTPTSSTFPSFVRYVDFYFSQPISSVGLIELNGAPIQGKIERHGSWVRYTHPEKFTEDSESTLVIKSIKSERGGVLDASLTFTPTYMDFEDVPKELQKASIEIGSSGQKDDPFFNNYFPLVSTEDGFEIEYLYNQADAKNSSLFVTFYDEVFNYDTNQQTILPNDQAEAKRLKVLDAIRKRGGTPEKYNIQYANKYLEAKYNPDGH